MGTAEIIFISLVAASVALIVIFLNSAVEDIPYEVENDFEQIKANLDYVNQVLTLK